MIHCNDAEQLHSLHREALASGYSIYQMPPGINDRASFYDAVRATFSLDPPVVGYASWDGLSDSLWEGLMNLSETRIAIFWPDAHSMFQDARRDFETALLVLGDVSEQLNDPVGTVGNPKELVVVVQAPRSTSAPS